MVRKKYKQILIILLAQITWLNLETKSYSENHVQPVVPFTTYEYYGYETWPKSVPSNTYVEPPEMKLRPGHFQLILGKSVQEIKNQIIWGWPDPAILDLSSGNQNYYNFKEYALNTELSVLEVSYEPFDDAPDYFTKNKAFYLIDNNNSVGCIIFDDLSVYSDSASYYQAITQLPLGDESLSRNLSSIPVKKTIFYEANRQDNYVERYAVVDILRPHEELRRNNGISKKNIIMQAIFPQSIESDVLELIEPILIHNYTNWGFSEDVNQLSPVD